MKQPKDEPSPKLLERIFAGFLLATLIHVWALGVVIVPIAAWRLWSHNDYRLAILLLIYYGYRYKFPSKEWELVRRIYGTGAKYFDYQRVIFDGFQAIPPASKSFICYHPHGTLTIGWALSSTDPVLGHAKIKWLVTEALMQLPFISDFLSWNGCAMATREYMTSRMAKGANLALIPGGFEEATLYKHGAYRVYIRKRTGFLVYCLRYGYKIYPTFVFGEERCYYAASWCTDFRLWLNKYKIPAVGFVGLLGIMPGPFQHLVSVIGQPLQLPRIEKPTDADITKYHALYVKALLEVFGKYKGTYAEKDAKLEIF